MENYIAAVQILHRLTNQEEPKPLINSTVFLYLAFLVASETEVAGLKAALPETDLDVAKAALTLIEQIRSGKSSVFVQSGKPLDNQPE